MCHLQNTEQIVLKLRLGQEEHPSQRKPGTAGNAIALVESEAAPEQKYSGQMSVVRCSQLYVLPG